MTLQVIEEALSPVCLFYRFSRTSDERLLPPITLVLEQSAL
jgi:hypothetical protein